MDTRTRLSFTAAVGALLVLYFASGSPISLYSLWQDRLDMTHAQLSMASMWYLLGTVIPLLFFSRISDHLERRPATVLILAFSLSGAAIFASVSSPEMIMAGRFIQGIASGLGSSTVAAYVVDLSQDLPRWVGPMITSSAPTLGLCTGAFVSGGLVEFTDVEPHAYFTAVMVLIIVIAIFIAISKETMDRSPGLLKSFIPKLGLPKNSGRLYAACAVTFIGTWAVGGFSQSFSSTIVRDSLGYSDPFVSAAVFTALLLPNAIGGFFASRFEVRSAQRIGFGSFGICLSLMLASIWGDSYHLIPFCIFSAIAGFSQGIAFTAGVTELVSRADQVHRASVFSLIYLTSYGGAAVPNLVVGMIPGDYAVSTILSWYVVLVAIMVVLLFVLSSKPYPGSTKETQKLRSSRQEPP